MKCVFTGDKCSRCKICNHEKENNWEIGKCRKKT